MTANVKAIVQLKLDQIKIDGGTQVRVTIDTNIVANYKDVLDELPPAVVFFDGCNYWLGDGFHRYHAHKDSKRGSMPCEKRIGTVRDAILYAVGANAEHGIQRTDADKHHAVRMLLEDKEWKDWSNREIARQCRVSEWLVREEKRLLRQEEEARKEKEKEAKRKAEEKARQEEEARKQAEKAQVTEGWVAPGKKPDEPQKAQASAGGGACASDTHIEQEQETVISRRGGTVYRQKAKTGSNRDRNVIRVEKNQDKKDALDNKIERSEKKYVCQCLQRGMGGEEIVERVRKRIAMMMPSVRA